MRVKLVPPPPDDLGTVAAVQRAVPLVPSPENDCCALIMERTDVESRDIASTWLSFLRGLGLVRETDRGFVRNRTEPTREALADGLESGVLGARELLDALSGEPLTPDDAFEVVRERVPGWERAKDHGWESTWRSRTERLLGWLALAGLTERVEDGYVRA